MGNTQIQFSSKKPGYLEVVFIFVIWRSLNWYTNCFSGSMVYHGKEKLSMI